MQKLDGITTVTSISPRGPPEPVYNLEVQVKHTYYVADSGVLVHNGKNCGVDDIAAKYGGTRIDGDSNPNAFMFPSKRSAKQAASEIAGNLGSSPTKVLQSSYRESKLSWFAAKSKKIIGKHSNQLDEFGNPSAGFHDHFLGHSAFNEPRAHINAWGRFGDFKDNIHLFYPK